MLGGAFIPVQAMPGWVQSVAPITFNYWGNEMLRAVAKGGAGVASPGTPAIALAGIAVTGIVAGMMLMHRRHLRGIA